MPEEEARCPRVRFYSPWLFWTRGTIVGSAMASGEGWNVLCYLGFVELREFTVCLVLQGQHKLDQANVVKRRPPWQTLETGHSNRSNRPNKEG